MMIHAPREFDRFSNDTEADIESLRTNAMSPNVQKPEITARVTA